MRVSVLVRSTAHGAGKSWLGCGSGIDSSTDCETSTWIAAQASVAEAATEVIIESMRRTARLKALAGCDYDDGPLPAASIRVIEGLLARGFARTLDSGQHYQLGTLSVWVTGGKHDKRASCRISLDSGGRNGLSSWEMSNCREDVLLVVIDALTTYLATESVQFAVAETWPDGLVSLANRRPNIVSADLPARRRARRA